MTIHASLRFVSQKKSDGCVSITIPLTRSFSYAWRTCSGVRSVVSRNEFLFNFSRLEMSAYGFDCRSTFSFKLPFVFFYYSRVLLTCRVCVGDVHFHLLCSTLQRETTFPCLVRSCFRHSLHLFCFCCACFFVNVKDAFTLLYRCRTCYYDVDSVYPSRHLTRVIAERYCLSISLFQRHSGMI